MKKSDVLQPQKLSNFVPLQKPHVSDASIVAAKAFADDPVLTYLVSDDREFRPIIGER